MSIEARLEPNKPLKELSTFGIGGPARLFITIETLDEMIALRKYINREKIPYWVVGKGSNSLFDDRGFDGLVILNKIDFIEMEEGSLYVGAGYSFSLLGAQTARKGWGGLEFASGIPGSVGGAIYMNAGAGGAEACDVLTSVGWIDVEGNFIETPRKELTFSYRTSPFQKKEAMIVSGRFQLEKVEGARKKQLEIIAYRTGTQPYGDKSAGCIFRNPKEKGAGALIEACGLKGKRIGGAEVSPMHANFIVNRGDATAADVLELARFIQEEVRQKTGHNLQMEVRKVPHDV
ncbi:UDP-N-acetylmuramate dehydrogenase [Candidatus Neptunochlamydia vexilliferae]|uniref:UDP-N-acetylenolpyruvoylglucosamine reductase n=1 Tax=Candidatus Neptunichlamydia vexilliferae TaxID=1651774 RepID=A0ABS0AX03_9BACT|nr:UDP-N-acetylmuramate dehydrogenase [Candidatus Neptunochlamydia vexilliferae]MBF5058669.1 UDP-N-acetylenolpyruvoylglucosamine reductase [Candidatus Neptunochlamydia vexilliferae]